MSLRTATTSMLLLLATGVVTASTPQTPDDQQGIIDFSSERWIKVNAEVVEHLGRSCLKGTAYLQDAGFDNGVIEYDIAVSGARSYPGITFRTSSPQEYEELYIRPHASNSPDAMQYVPVFSGVSGWQLYNGEGFNANVEIPTNKWIHIRVEILGKQGRVFFNHEPTPVLVIDELKHDVVKGNVGIKSAPDGSAYFSNFKLTVTGDLDLGPAPQPVVPRGLITRWQISQPFPALAIPRETYPADALLESIEWQAISSESSGLVDLCRHVKRNPAVPEVLFARAVVEAKEDGTVQLAFGYSDQLTLFLNRRPLFSGNAAYRSRSATYLGAVSLEDSVFLPLAKGSNELLLMVSESLGGWGFIAKLLNDDLLAPGITRLWRLETELSMPESVVYDPQRQTLYVSNYYRGGQECLSKIALDGTVTELEWVGGLSRPTGMVVDGNRLWVVERTGLVEVDIEQAEVVKRYPAAGAVFPNDVALDSTGRIYVSDSAGGKVYRLEGDTLQVWLEGEAISQVNGILADGDRLLLGTSSDGCIKAARLDSGEVETFTCIGSGSIVDGLCPDGSGGYIVSDFNGRVLRITPSGGTTVLIDTTSSQTRSADLMAIPSKQLLIVPGLNDNNLTAYQLSGLAP